MTRKKLEFLYSLKKFICRELTVWEYLFLLENYEEAITKILENCEPKNPELNSRQFANFFQIILWNKIQKTLKEIFSKQEKQKADLSEILESVKIFIWYFMCHLHQNYSEIMGMPLSDFDFYCKNLNKILWTEKEEAQEQELDKTSFKQEFSNFYN